MMIVQVLRNVVALCSIKKVGSALTHFSLAHIYTSHNSFPPHTIQLHSFPPHTIQLHSFTPCTIQLHTFTPHTPPHHSFPLLPPFIRTFTRILFSISTFLIIHSLSINYISLILKALAHHFSSLFPLQP